jgi:hypothetical protein
MDQETYAATAAYFEARAAKARTARRQQQLKAVARLYLQKAGAGTEPPISTRPAPLPTRRERLIALFRVADISGPSGGV